MACCGLGDGGAAKSGATAVVNRAAAARAAREKASFVAPGILGTPEEGLTSDCGAQPPRRDGEGGHADAQEQPGRRQWRRIVQQVIRGGGVRVYPRRAQMLRPNADSTANTGLSRSRIWRIPLGSSVAWSRLLTTNGDPTSAAATSKFAPIHRPKDRPRAPAWNANAMDPVMNTAHTRTRSARTIAPNPPASGGTTGAAACANDHINPEYRSTTSGIRRPASRRPAQTTDAERPASREDWTSSSDATPGAAIAPQTAPAPDIRRAAPIAQGVSDWVRITALSP